jgi:hypothetical protein
MSALSTGLTEPGIRATALQQDYDLGQAVRSSLRLFGLRVCFVIKVDPANALSVRYHCGIKAFDFSTTRGLTQKRENCVRQATDRSDHHLHGKPRSTNQMLRISFTNRGRMIREQASEFSHLALPADQSPE